MTFHECLKEARECLAAAGYAVDSSDIWDSLWEAQEAIAQAKVALAEREGIVYDI